MREDGWKRPILKEIFANFSWNIKISLKTVFLSASKQKCAKTIEKGLFSTKFWQTCSETSKSAWKQCFWALQIRSVWKRLKKGFFRKNFFKLSQKHQNQPKESVFERFKSEVCGNGWKRPVLNEDLANLFRNFKISLKTVFLSASSMKCVKTAEKGLFLKKFLQTFPETSKSA